MKKNSIYLSGAVALTLLATAPIVTPIMGPVVGTTDVKAWAGIDANPSKTSEEMIKEFAGQFGDRYIASTDSLSNPLEALDGYSDNFYYFDPSNPRHIHDIQHDTQLDKLKNIHLSPSYFQDSNSDYYYRDILGYLTVSDANGEIDVSNKQKLKDNLISNLKNVEWPLTITIHLSSSKEASDGVGSVYEKPSLDSVPEELHNISFKIYLSTFNITKDTNVIDVDNGTNLSKVNGTDKLTVTDNYANDTGVTKDYMDKMGTPNYGSLFKTQDDAENYIKSDNFDPSTITSSATGNATDALNLNSDKTDGILNKPGTYYQVVSYKLSDGYHNTGELDADGKTKKIDGDRAIYYMFSGDSDKDPLTGVNTQPYETKINGTVSTEDKDYFLNSKAQTISIVRVIKVADKATASITSPSAKVGLTIEDLSNSKGNALVDENNNSLLSDTKKISFGNDFYASSEQPQDVLNGTAQPVSITDENGKLNKTGSFYRTITFPLKDGVDISAYNLSDAYKDNGDGTVTFVQKVTVNPKSTSTSGSHSSSSHNWTITYPTGTVTTKNDQNSYPVVNDDDKVIDGTTIPKDTPLKIDRARTDQAGNKQYHIANDEWIDANYVTLDNQAGLSVTDHEKGVLYVDKTASYYKLFDNNGKEITNRALGENTYWAVDEIATDNQGNTYYRVATNEWVKQVNGVHYPIPLNLINIQENRGVLYLDGTRQNYTLYDQNGRVITNRALGADSYWTVDKVANDNEGNTYYRVATNEWIEQRNGVHYPVK